MPSIKVLIASPGVGHVYRGFESFAQDCFAALRPVGELEVLLAKGWGRPAPGELLVPVPRRERTLAKAASRLVKRDATVVEVTAFALGLHAHLARVRPDVVYFSEWHIGRVLAVTRDRLPKDPALLYCNGGPGTPPFAHVDHVQEVSLPHYRAALAAGEPELRETLLPLGAAIEPRLRAPAPAERAALRERLGLPVDRPIVLSVGALDRSHKRQDYVITEHARLPPPRPHLVLLGHESAESPAIRALARERLPSEDITLKSVPAGEVADYYAAADVFVLASTREAFGRVLVEALAHGLPCIAHDYDVPRWVLGEHGTFADLTVPGGLADAVSEVLGVPDGRAADRHAYVRAHYSWEALRPRYVELIRRVAAGPRAELSGVRALRRAR